MLKFKQNMEFKCLEPIRTKSGAESLAERINTNYQQISTHFEKEDLLHLVMNSPEIFLDETPMTNLIENNNIQNTQQIKVDMINNILNRIMLLNTQEFSYHDTVYISNVLKKLGIQDVNVFLKEISNLQQETENTTKLTKLYSENVDRLQKYVKEYSESNITQNNNNNDTSVINDNRVFYLQDKVLARLDTARIYEELTRVHEQIPGKEARILNTEIALSEQKRFANAYNMQNIVNHVHQNNMPLTYLRENIYEENNEEINNTEESVVNKLTSAIMLSLSDNLYTVRKQNIDNKREWYDFRNIISKTSQNTIERVEAYYKNDEAISISNHAYAQSIQNDRRMRAELTTQLVESIKEGDINSTIRNINQNTENRTFVSESMHNTNISDSRLELEHIDIGDSLTENVNSLELSNTNIDGDSIVDISNEIQNQKVEEINRLVQNLSKNDITDGLTRTEFNEQHLEFLESISNEKYTQEDNAITNVESLKQQLDLINQQNVERLKQFLETNKETEVKTNVVIDRKKAMRDTLKAIENPEELMKALSETADDDKDDIKSRNNNENLKNVEQNLKIYDIINNIENISKKDVNQKDFTQVNQYHAETDNSENVNNENAITNEINNERVENIIDKSVSQAVSNFDERELLSKQIENIKNESTSNYNSVNESTQEIQNKMQILEQTEEITNRNINNIDKSLNLQQNMIDAATDDTTDKRALDVVETSKDVSVQDIVKNVELLNTNENMNNEFMQVNRYHTEVNLNESIDSDEHNDYVTNANAVNNNIEQNTEILKKSEQGIKTLREIEHSTEKREELLKKLEEKTLETQNNTFRLDETNEQLKNTIRVLEKPNEQVLRYLDLANEDQEDKADVADNPKAQEQAQKIFEIIKNIEKLPSVNQVQNTNLQQVNRYHSDVAYEDGDLVDSESNSQNVNMQYAEYNTHDEIHDTELQQTNTETLKQELDKINQRNIEKYLQLKESRKEISKREDVIIDRKSAMRDTLKAITNPDEVIMTYLSQTTPEEERLEKQDDTLKALMAPETKKIFEVLEDITNNPQTKYLDKLRPVELELVTREVEQFERQTVEAEKIERENKLHQSEQKLIQEIQESQRQVRQVNNITKQQTEKINFIHKTVDNTITDEILESLAEQREFMNTQNRIDRTVSTSNIENRNYEEVNTVNHNFQNINQENINELVRSSVKTELGNISDKVYAQIEKKLTMERKRRGY